MASAETEMTTKPDEVSPSLSSQILEQSFGDKELVRRIKASNVLLVGAGGVGCEVIKGLLLSGFENITLIDLDTIDVSNLNRQFLYNKSHVGQSKAKVAASVSVERFSHRDPETNKPISKVVPIHDSILSLEYNRQFYKQFTFVINALDNNLTRVHVNRMCLTANVPLVESASAGYFGNVKIILGGVTSCFECDPPSKDENTYASCTIRNTPSLPIHCIVWAKHLFAQLFGQSEEDISPDVSDPKLMSAEGEENSGLNGSAETNGDLNGDSTDQHQQPMSTRNYVEKSGYDPKALFEKIFYRDIIYLKKMKDLWKNRKAPKELNYEEIVSGAGKFEDSSDNSSNENEANFVIRDQKKWDMYECYENFQASLAKLKARLSNEAVIEWDKDDDVALDFVTSVSNFRSYCFGIDRKSKFEVKSLAGNIIPAISTTNTIVGGYIILDVIRLLSSILPERIWKNADVDTTKLDAEKLKEEADVIMNNTFWGYVANRGDLSKTGIERCKKPAKSCLVCSSDIKEIVVALPLSKTTLGDFVNEVVKKKFKTIAPDISVLGTSIMLWADDEEDDDDDEETAKLREKILSSYSFMKDGVTLSLKDLEQNFEVHMLVKDVEFDPEENDGEFCKVCNQSELDNIITDVKNGSEKAGATNGGPAELVEPVASTSKTALINLMDEDDFVCIEDEEKAKAAVAASAKMVLPNDDDFEMIEMSELDGFNVETRKSTSKRPISGDDLVTLDYEDVEQQANSTAQNGNTESNNTPSKRIRTN